MEQANNGSGAPSGATRRTVIKGAAWSVPVIAAAVAVPMAAASGGVIIESAAATLSGDVCDVLGEFSFTVKAVTGGTPAKDRGVIVTLPEGFTWGDGESGSKTLTTDSSGVITIDGVTSGTKPGTYLITAQVVGDTASTSIVVAIAGVWIEARQGYGGTGVFPVYMSAPADGTAPDPDGWAYCIEHNVDAETGIAARAGDTSSYLGGNNFKDDAVVQGRVLWVLAHSYPTLSLEDFGTAAGVPGISRNDAIEATQYAIWRYTDLSYDASWDWETDESKDAYWYLVNGANAVDATALPPSGTVISVPTAPCTTPTADDHAQSLVLAAPSL
ncbi:MAG: thioester domain-containing protein [Microbacterium sp.]